MSRVEDLVEKAIDDLKTKISGLEAVDSSIDENDSNKIEDIKNKSITVLKKAIKKIEEINEEVMDADEVIGAIKVVENKSKQLYDISLEKINALLQKQGINPVLDKTEEKVETKQEESKPDKIVPQEILPEEKDEEEIVIENSKAIIKKLDVTTASIEALRSWLKTGEKNKWRK